MIALLRVAAVAVAGAALYQAGVVNGIVQLTPSPLGALFTTLAIAAAFVLMVMALTGTGRGDALAPGPPAYAGPIRAAFVVVSLLAILGLAWLRGISSPPVHDATPYHNDAIALNECAAQQVLRGENPYTRLDLFECYDARGIGPDRTTPLRRGAFADVRVYPTEEQLDAAWVERARGGWSADIEFQWRPSYPALSILLILPWVALGWDANVLYVLCLLAAMVLVLARAPAGMRPFVLTGLLAAVSLTAFTVGGSSDLLYALPLVAAWLWRERRWSAVALAVAVAVKQLAWFFAPFYLMQVAARHGWREAAIRLGVAAAIFAAVNAPFILWDARSWFLGVVGPLAEPMFPRGAGLVFLSANGVLPLFPAAAYLALEAVVGLAVLAVAWRARHTSPELGVVLAMLPLFFAWRSLFSYFFLLPLFAIAAIARMPTGDLAAETARRSGAVTVLAAPRPERT
ncbi:MAG: glycosyltransferase 87 family protein [Candidatus Limnocylindria bacterium]